MSDISSFTPEQRTRALLYYFWWQGGTIHQLAKETGLDVQTILYGTSDCGKLSEGFSAVRTCDHNWRRDKLAPQHKGDWAYWRDVIKGFWATGPLDGGPR